MSIYVGGIHIGFYGGWLTLEKVCPDWLWWMVCRVPSFDGDGVDHSRCNGSLVL